MADDSLNDRALAPLVEDEEEDDDVKKKKKKKEKAAKKKRGMVSRILNGIFRIGSRGGDDDFEKRLKHISKEEASVLARMKNRSRVWRRIARNLVVFSVFLEVIAVVYAIMTTRSIDLDWKMRAVRVLPMFLLPGLSSAIYFTLINFIKMCDSKDQKTLERLRDERKEKINELKERTNYYTTQQLIQRYDPDPAAKAAAASVLASKLGADSGLKVYLGEESMLDGSFGKSNDNEFHQSTGLRNRKHSHSRSNSTPNIGMPHFMEEAPSDVGSEDSESPPNQSVIVDHHPKSTAYDNGWFARIAALLVGEDPTQSYALICGNCHMHNGLARKEDFPYITYYCPHCHALNKSRQLEESAPVSINEEHPPVPSSTSTSISGSPTHIEGASSLTENKLLSANLSPVAETVPSDEDKVSD